ncbi:hypothetical protein SAMN04515671_2069 [Nakamurella panacisegetis]|uniref:Uncharacterized protein n=1 Tax=Nakamurella panacisegetis TaxID=1090615 RepID=A0A1H0MPX1_9ACTN|nr:hypothetical protein [Nakamurella panacisegetis]SDO82335.1 hypothetical protein SAMN04515671_2069 [Nakamurella panacisegetis]
MVPSLRAYEVCISTMNSARHISSIAARKCRPTSARTPSPSGANPRNRSSRAPLAADNGLNFDKFVEVVVVGNNGIQGLRDLDKLDTLFAALSHRPRRALPATLQGHGGSMTSGRPARSRPPNGGG